MSNNTLTAELTAGAVVEVVTSRGLAHAIVSNIHENQISGFLVRAGDHREILSPFSATVDDVVVVEDGERAAVSGADEGVENGLVIFKDDRGVLSLTVQATGRTRRFSSVRKVVDAVINYYWNNQRDNEAKSIERTYDMTIAVLQEMLDAD